MLSLKLRIPVSDAQPALREIVRRSYPDLPDNASVTIEAAPLNLYQNQMLGGGAQPTYQIVASWTV